MSLHNSGAGNKRVIMGQSQAGYRGRDAPPICWVPPSPAKVEKRVPERSLPSGSHLWRMRPDWGMAPGVPVLSSKGLASIQDPLETATPGPTETDGGRERRAGDLESSLAWLAGGG